MEQDFYDILGVSRDADSAAIRQAFKKLALTHHPDKVAESERPDAEVRFKIISEAYEVSSNEETRISYDAQASFGGQFGGANGASQDWQDFYYADAGGTMPDFFDFAAGSQFHDAYADAESGGFFNGHANGSANSRKHARFARRTEDARFDVDLTSEDVYFGKMIKSKTQRQVSCRRCQGTGGRQGARKYRCQTCKGFGTTKKTQWAGPGSSSTSTVFCDVCHGSGEIFRNKDLCRRCRGARTQEMKTMIEVYVPKGVKNRHRIVVEGQADEEPGKETGDLVIVVHIDAQHPVFRREGADSYASAQISSREALTGFSRPSIKHLDGRESKPTVPRGQIVQPQSILKIAGEGLVVEDNVNGVYEDFTGDSYLQISVEFPTNIESHILDKVAQSLSTPATVDEDELDGGVSDDTSRYTNDEKEGTPNGKSPRESPEAGAEDTNETDNSAEGNVTVADVDYEVMTEAQSPEYAADVNDDPEEEEEEETESPFLSGANFGTNSNPLSGCSQM